MDQDLPPGLALGLMLATSTALWLMLWAIFDCVSAALRLL